MKVKTRLTRLMDGRAKYISLVHRAASQVPFRILKEDRTTEAKPPPPNKEAPMLDLSTLRIRKTATSENLPAETSVEAPDQQVLAVVVHKSANLDEVKKALTEAGLKTDSYELSEDGQHVFKQAEATADEPTSIIRQDDNVALIVKGFDAYKAMTSSFADRIGIQGYWDGISMATRAVNSAITTAIADAGSPEEAMTAVDVVVSEFHDYMQGLIEALPAVCFTPNIGRITKAAAPVPDEEVAKADKMCPDCGKSMVHKCAVQKSDEPAKDEKPAEVPAPAPVVTDKPADVPPAPPAPPAEEVKKTDPAPAPVVESDSIQKSLAAFAETLASIKKSADEAAELTKASIAKISEEVKTLAEKTDTAIKKSDETASKLKGTIAAPAPAEPDKATHVKKSDETVRPFGSGETFDTALMRHKR